MDFTIPEELRMLQGTVKRFVEEECIPVERQMQMEDPDWVELPHDIHKGLEDKLKKIGLWALSVPTEYGGGGIGTIGMVLVREEQSKTVIGTAHHNPFGGDPPGILYLGTPEQKERYLFPVIRGEKRSAMANTEPDAGSDAAAITTSAVRDGDNWVINGTKRFSTMADRADFAFVTAVTDKQKRGRGGITMFIVDKGTPGFTITRKLPVIRPQYSTEIVFDNCVVPSSQVLGEVGGGFGIAQAWMGAGRMMMASSCVGRADRALKMTIDYAKQRSTFGQLLAQRQAVQWMLVDSAVDIKATRLMCLEGAWKVEQGTEDIRQDASMIKLFATEMAFRTLDRAIQIHGGIGLSKDLILERWFREIRVMRIVEGASEVQRFVIARNLLRD